MKKRIAAGILALALLLPLFGCGKNTPAPMGPERSEAETSDTTASGVSGPLTPSAPEATPPPEPPPLRFTREELPRLDGSTSTVPLGVAIAAAILGESPGAAEELIRFSRTTASFRQLMWDNADLLIVAEPSPAVFDELEEAGVEILMEPFATDALIFVVNEENPVDSLTAEQLRKIYAGEITNWKEVGGEDLPIDAFQRNAESGSQVLMEKLVMDGTPMAQAPTGYMIGEMGTLMEAVRGYDNSASAIGYSVYYYASDMEMAQGLKILAVDGAAPSPDSIRQGSYPFRNPYYVVRRKDAPEESPTARLFDWILSPQGQRLVAEQGYVSILDTGAVTPTGGEAVTPLVESWYPEPPQDLIPSPDYGRLIPYIGGETSNPYWGNGYLLGLATEDGVIVTDSVFLHADYSPCYDAATGVTTYPPVFLLSKPVSQGDYARFQYGLAASDGSWYTGLIYASFIAATPFGMLMVEEGGDVVHVGVSGEEIFRWDGDSIPLPGFKGDAEGYWEGMSVREDYFLYVTEWVDGHPRYAYVHLPTGHVFDQPPADLPPEPRYPVTDTNFPGGSYRVEGERILVSLADGRELSLPLLEEWVEGIYGDRVVLRSGDSAANSSITITDLEGNILLDAYRNENWLHIVPQYIPGPPALFWTGYPGAGGLLGDSGSPIASPLGPSPRQYGDRLIFMDEDAYRVTGLEGTDLLRIPRIAAEDD